MSRPGVACIAAMDRNRVIGRDGDLPWRLPDDLKRFKALTTGHPVLMGRKTWDSIGRPLPNRRNLVLTRRPDFDPPGAEAVASPEEALARTEGADWLFVIGGGAVYAAFLPLADRLYLTRVHAAVNGGDAFFPPWNPSDFEEVEREAHPVDDRHAVPFEFVTYRKRHE